MEKELRNAWMLRNSQQIDAAESVLKALKAKNLKDVDLQMQVELDLLDASLKRAHRKLDQSEQLLLKVKSTIEESGLSVTFQYYLQRGLNLFYQGYFPSALEYFTRAIEITSDPEQKVLALGNQLLCLECLSLPTKDAIQNLKSYQNQITPEYYENVIKPQTESLEARQAFRAGDLNFIFSKQDAVTRDTKAFSQKEYLKLWIGQLPYLNLEERQSDLSRLISAPHFIWKNYRIHTLWVDSRYADEEQVKVSERVDRLYLWLWKWMVDPNSLANENIEDCWASLEPKEVCSQTTIEDFVMLRMCLRWTRLWEPRWESASNEWLKKSTPPHIQQSGVFQIESLVLDYLEACKKKLKSEAQKILKVLEKHPLYTSEQFLFKDLIEGFHGQSKRGSSMSQLGEKLASRTKEKRKSLSKNLTLNLNDSTWRLGAEGGVSKPICLLIHTLKNEQSLSFSDLMELCFSIDGYDEDHHQRKIMNLLTRVRKLLPNEIKIFTKDQRVYVEGSFKSVRFINEASENVKWSLPRIFDLPCMEQNKHHLDRWIQPSLVFKKLKNKKTLSRQEIQDFLKLSKATSNRLLQRWVNEGFLSKSSAGRSTIYHVNTTHLIRLTSCDS